MRRHVTMLVQLGRVESPYLEAAVCGEKLHMQRGDCYASHNLVDWEGGKDAPESVGENCGLLHR